MGPLRCFGCGKGFGGSFVSSGRLVIPQRIFGVIGPTAAGKSSLALRLAELLGGEIVCCDALQVRAGLPILTAKATEAELQRAPHHLLGTFPCDQPATAAQYAKQADLAIADIARRGRAVILCGGTGLYLRALRDGLFAGPGGDPELRRELRAQAEREGISSLHARLVAIDPSAAQRIGPTDYVRIERALEVFTLTGRPISDWQKDSQVERAQGPRYDIALLGVDPGPEVLHRRIARRAAAMLDAGLVQEVRDSLQQDGSLKYPPLGYELVRRHLSGELSLAELQTELAQKTGQYARRQRTWFRKEPVAYWTPDPERVPIVQLLEVLSASGPLSSSALSDFSQAQA